jgi:hypothetical protein
MIRSSVRKEGNFSVALSMLGLKSETSLSASNRVVPSHIFAGRRILPIVFSTVVIGFDSFKYTGADAFFETLANITFSHVWYSGADARPITESDKFRASVGFAPPKFPVKRFLSGASPAGIVPSAFIA